MVVISNGAVAGKIALAGAAYAIVTQIIHFISAQYLMQYYQDPALYPIWSQLMMPNGGAPGMEFFAASLAVNFVAGCIFAYAYSSSAVCVAGLSVWEKGFNFGILLFLLTTLTGILAMWLLLAIPQALLLAWAMEGLATSIAAGTIIAHVFETL